MKLRQLPFWLFIGLCVLFAIGLTLNPRSVPSALLDKPAPSLQAGERLTQPDFDLNSLSNRVWLMNVWASWCLSCAAEHAQLLKIQSTTQWPLIGLNYRDDAQEAEQWLAKKGNPYQTVVFDADGRLAMDWGITAAPETFIIDAQGKVRFRLTGPITEQNWQEEILPKLQQLQTAAELL